MLTEELLGQYSKLIVVKSISKSYGVPGLRLGVLASGNETLIADLKKRAVIWNINSFAEYYMQIAEKYKKDYVAAMEKFREERAGWLANWNRLRICGCIRPRQIISWSSFWMADVPAMWCVSC